MLYTDWRQARRGRRLTRHGRPRRAVRGHTVQIVVLAGLALLAAPAFASAAGLTTRVSVGSGGEQGNGNSVAPAISADGRYIAFSSDADTLVAGDTNGVTDVFVHDMQTGVTERVSVSGDEDQANAPSQEPAISADGRYVAFISTASNLVAGDVPGGLDVFVRDRQTGLTERISAQDTGAQPDTRAFRPAISADGRYVAFSSLAPGLVPDDTNGFQDLFVYDRDLDVTERASVDSDELEGNHRSAEAAISGDGRYVAFKSFANNLVGDDTNFYDDVFVRDRTAGTTERVSVATDGTEGDSYSYEPAMSADGRYVVFTAWATTLVPGDTNDRGDVFLHDRDTGVTERVSIDSTGGNADEHSIGPSISADGRHVAFWSFATDLVPGEPPTTLFDSFTSVFVRDLDGGPTERVSVNTAGEWADQHSYVPSISADGRHVAFLSYASNLNRRDTNDFGDIFLRDRLAPADTTAPDAPPAPDLDAASDSGRSDSDNATTATTLHVDGTAEPDALVRVFVDGTEVGTDIAEGDGTYDVWAFGVTEGVRLVTATATDESNNTSAASDALSVTVDLTPPTVVCQSPAPQFGVGQSGATVSATIQDAGSGPDALTPSSPQTADTSTAGTRTVSYTATDVAGNSSDPTECSYTVAGYVFLGFSSPRAGSSVRAGGTVRIKFALGSAPGVRLPSAEAAALVNPAACRIRVHVLVPLGFVAPGCPTYATRQKEFQYELMTTTAMRSTSNGIYITIMDGATVITTSPTQPITVK